MELKKRSLAASIARWFDAYAGHADEGVTGTRRFDWTRLLPFAALHLGCLGVIWTGVSEVAVLVAVALYALRRFAITGFYHRYFSHCAFRTSRAAQFVFAVMGAAAVQRGPLWWASHHRHHHASSDTPADAHSSLQHGFLWSHMGWFLARENFAPRNALVADFARYPELRFLDRYDALVPLSLAAVLYGVGEWLGAAAPALATSGAQLVVWPENIVNVRHLDTSYALQEVAAEATRLHAPIIVGITESDADPSRFRNAQVVVMPDGTIMGRYEKKRRVPFGEYMPMRGLLSAIGAPTYLVPRDAVAGTNPAVVDTPVGTLGVAISWEIFFGGRVREAVRNGAGIIINPTNGASYRGTVLQSQQVAASRLRAIESGRWVAQVSPTGFSAFITPEGKVLDRIGQTVAGWRERKVEVRTGLTWYERLGDKPFVLLIVLLWSLPTFERLWRRWRAALTPPQAV